PKEEEENSMHNTVVMFSTSDLFTLRQCGQCYHPYCVNVKNNFSLCGPCSSLRNCPLCQRLYHQDDLILQCNQCDR
ncbi:Histone-lysine N-methyltransferase 2C, partial [Dissostichus eleginoides]